MPRASVVGYANSSQHVKIVVYSWYLIANRNKLLISYWTAMWVVI